MAETIQDKAVQYFELGDIDVSDPRWVETIVPLSALGVDTEQIEALRHAVGEMKVADNLRPPLGTTTKEWETAWTEALTGTYVCIDKANEALSNHTGSYAVELAIREDDKSFAPMERTMLEDRPYAFIPAPLDKLVPVLRVTK